MPCLTQPRETAIRARTRCREQRCTTQALRGGPRGREADQRWTFLGGAEVRGGESPWLCTKARGAESTVGGMGLSVGVQHKPQAPAFNPKPFLDPEEAPPRSLDVHTSRLRSMLGS